MHVTDGQGWVIVAAIVGFLLLKIYQAYPGGFKAAVAILCGSIAALKIFDLQIGEIWPYAFGGFALWYAWTKGGKTIRTLVVIVALVTIAAYGSGVDLKTFLKV